jgi:hypothetical protein
VVEESAGRGDPRQARASALFEAWEHYYHKRQFDEMRRYPSRMRLNSAKDIALQPQLAPDFMLRRLATDFLARMGIPALPTGRGMARLASRVHPDDPRRCGSANLTCSARLARRYRGPRRSSPCTAEPGLTRSIRC